MLTAEWQQPGRTARSRRYRHGPWLPLTEGHQHRRAV